MILNRIAIIFVFLTTTLVSSQENLYTSISIPDSLKQSANAVVRLNETNIIIESQRSVNIKLKRIVTVLNEKGNKHIQAITGYDKYNKVKSIEAKIYDANGKEIKKVKKRDFIDHSAVDGGTLYSDSRMLFMAYMPVSYPYTVQFSLELESSNTAAIPTWRPIDSYYVSVENDHYKLTDIENLGLRIKEKNFGDYKIDSQNTSTSLHYSVSNVIPLKPEALSPSLQSFTPSVMVAVEKFHYDGVNGEAKDWKTFGNWINTSLLKGRDELSAETKEQVIELVKGIDDPIEKAKKIYNYVQENTRYISVQVGIGGIQPIAALEVDELKYGDCKGLTNYTKALLNTVNVESYYTVVEAGKEIIGFEEDFASLEQGNHIILAIPNNDDIIFLDCTSQIHPFGFIGDFTDNRNVLLVKGDSSKIAKTTNYPDESNYQHTTSEITINEDAKIDAHVTISTKGIQYDNRFSIETEPHKDIIEYYKKYWGYVNNLEVEKYAFNNNKDTIEFTEEVDVYARNYCSINGDRLLFKPNFFNRNRFVPDRYRKRQQPLSIQRGYLDEDEFNIVLPKNYKVEALPKNIVIKNEFGEYSTEYNLEENMLYYKRKLFIKSGNYDKSKYDLYRNFRKKVSKHDNSKLILIKS